MHSLKRGQFLSMLVLVHWWCTLLWVILYLIPLLFWVFSCKIIVVYALISSPGYIFNMVFSAPQWGILFQLVCNLSDFESEDFCWDFLQILEMLTRLGLVFGFSSWQSSGLRGYSLLISLPHTHCGWPFSKGGLRKSEIRREELWKQPFYPE